MGQRMVDIATLGICEHCGIVLTIEDFPVEAIDAIWKCSKCEGELTYKSFGYNKGEEGAKKVRWVGPGGKWVRKFPKEDFNLGNWYVVIKPVAPIYY